MGRKKVSTETTLKVKILLKEGYSKADVAQKCGVSRKFVYNVAEKVSKGLPLKNAPGQGRPRSTSQKEDRLIVRKCKANRTASSREIAIDINSTRIMPISSRTVRRRLVENGLFSYTQKKRPFHNRKQIKKRFAWCRDHLNWTITAWEKVCFSDESHFEVLNRKNRKLVRRIPSERDSPFSFSTRTQGGGGSVSVWGCFSVNGMGLLMSYDGRLNSTKYINLLKDDLPNYLDDLYGLHRDDWHFMQDNAPCHKAKKTMEWLKNERIPLLDWPPTSPDLNPIENIWEIIDQKLAQYQINNKQDLWNAIKDVWDKIPIEHCRNLIHSMPKRVEAVHKVNGRNIHKY